MVATAVRPASEVGPDTRAAASRSVRPRRSLPGGRAIVGALLVTAAAVALFGAYLGATSSPKHRYLVATRDVARGDRLTAGEVEAQVMDLNPDVADRAFTVPEQVRGDVVLVPLHRGELLDRSALSDDHQRPGVAQVSFSIDADRAVDGTLQAGDLVDVVVTYGTGTGSSTEVVASRAELLSTPASTASSNGLSGGRRQTVRLAVDTLDNGLRLVNAVRAGEVTLVRTTGYRGRDYTSSSFSPGASPSSAPSSSAPSPTATRPAGAGTGG